VGAHVAVVCLLIASACASAQTPDEMKKQMDAGQYREALRSIGEALSKRKASDDQARYQLLMMRGECQLQLDQRADAASAFESAAKSAGNIVDAAMARANVVLIRASAGSKYAPKSGGDAIDIKNAESRKQAYSTLRDDLLKANESKIQAAMHDNTLAPTMKILPTVLDIAYLEYASSGSAENTHTALKELGDHARSLMRAELNRLRRQANLAEDVSNSASYGGRRGLNTTERDGLQQSIDYVTQIAQTAREARRRARALGFDGSAWEPIIADADDLLELQKGVLAIAN
jgi:hypothetical protein